MNSQGYVVYGIKEYSNEVIDMLERFGKDYQFIDISVDGHALGFIAKQGLSPTIHIFHNGVYVGGHRELSSHIFTK